MVNKPLREKKIVDNVLKHGTGAINVDACRIPFAQNGDEWAKSQYPHRTKGYEASSYKIDYNRESMTSQRGRFPANLLVSDKALDTGTMSRSGKIKPHHQLTEKKNQIYGKYNRKPAEEQVTYGDMGDQSRYFDLDAWAKHHGFLDVPKASRSERNKGCEAFFWLNGKRISKTEYLELEKQNESLSRNKRFRIAKGNIHPTVKPVKLGAYLITLGCPPNGVTLDPSLEQAHSLLQPRSLVDTTLE